MDLEEKESLQGGGGAVSRGRGGASKFPKDEVSACGVLVHS